MLGGECACCHGKITLRNIRRHIINHIWYIPNDVVYSQYSLKERKEGVYMGDLIPLIEANPKRFNALCRPCNYFITTLTSMKDKKFNSIVKLTRLQRRYQAPD